MYAVEFRTQITNGHICVPEELRSELTGAVRVLVLVEADNGAPSSQQRGGQPDARPSDPDLHSEERRPGESLLAYRLRNPYPVSNFKPLSREEVHERRADYKPD